MNSKAVRSHNNKCFKNIVAWRAKHFHNLQGCYQRLPTAIWCIDQSYQIPCTLYVFPLVIRFRNSWPQNPVGLNMTFANSAWRNICEIYGWTSCGESLCTCLDGGTHKDPAFDGAPKNKRSLGCGSIFMGRLQDRTDMGRLSHPYGSTPLIWNWSKETRLGITLYLGGHKSQREFWYFSTCVHNFPIRCVQNTVSFPAMCTYVFAEIFKKLLLGDSPLCMFSTRLFCIYVYIHIYIYPQTCVWHALRVVLTAVLELLLEALHSSSGIPAGLPPSSWESIQNSGWMCKKNWEIKKRTQWKSVLSTTSSKPAPSQTKPSLLTPNVTKGRGGRRVLRKVRPSLLGPPTGTQNWTKSNKIQQQNKQKFNSTNIAEKNAGRGPKGGPKGPNMGPNPSQTSEIDIRSWSLKGAR